ncbi:MAG: hemolysin III family protein [Oligoflexia bacterium]|nr:hemolysin III family protein [Oligoflexia bacterium]
MINRNPPQKPRLRGYFHQEAFFTALGACALLIAKSSSQRAWIASSIYSLGLLFLFGISALYHRPYWEPRARTILRRFDHSAIFILIAGTFTPICLLSLSETSGHRLLLIIWSAAFLGIFQSVFWTNAPKWFTALFYVVVGWLALPYLDQLKASLGRKNLSLIVAGGIVYTIGAVFYATKKPKLSPAVFGYHEVFHLFTIIAAIFQFIVIYQLIT